MQKQLCDFMINTENVDFSHLKDLQYSPKTWVKEYYQKKKESKQQGVQPSPMSKRKQKQSVSTQHQPPSATKGPKNLSPRVSLNAQGKLNSGRQLYSSSSYKLKEKEEAPGEEAQPHQGTAIQWSEFGQQMVTAYDELNDKFQELLAQRQEQEKQIQELNSKLKKMNDFTDKEVQQRITVMEQLMDEKEIENLSLKE